MQEKSDFIVIFKNTLFRIKNNMKNLTNYHTVKLPSKKGFGQTKPLGGELLVSRRIPHIGKS